MAEGFRSFQCLETNRSHTPKWVRIEENVWSLELITSAENENISIPDSRFIFANRLGSDPGSLKIATLSSTSKAYETFTLSGESISIAEFEKDIKDHFSSRDVPTTRNIAILLNPIGGLKDARFMFDNALEPMLKSADITYTLVETQSETFVSEWCQSHDLSQYSDFATIGGDGLIAQFLNGMYQRSDWATLKETPMLLLPGGSGNALASASDCLSGNRSFYQREEAQS